MPKPIVTHPIVHLAIDVQSRYLRSLSKERQDAFPKAVRQIADILRNHDIPTIWVALLDKPKFHARRAVWSPIGAGKRRETQLKKFDLARITAHEDEDIFIKNANDAFESSLAGRLQNYKTKTLIVSGMNTRYCVAATISGAVQENFRCLVVTDLLADMGVHDLLETDPKWHRKNVETALLANLEKKIESAKRRTALFSHVEFCTTGDILAAHRKSPALAKKLAAVLCKRKQRR